MTDVLAVPFERRFNGWAPGVQELNEPTTLTGPSRVAAGRENVNVQVADLVELDLFSTAASLDSTQAHGSGRVQGRVSVFRDGTDAMTGM
ncbi:hypothetical protein CSO01_16400 [Cellulomonas soli]|uniref:Uncharacterized protein n=1 Tax=Cellulomonas soli TaxID=931535 RepID=A0A512PCI8_9CELL|nr:hypothetical protein CSO01_16400 [Cellulomonas soli]